MINENDKEIILNKVDHTILAQSAVWEDVKKICDGAMKYNVASVCIAPCFVKQVKDYFNSKEGKCTCIDECNVEGQEINRNKVKICTVIGFPNGYNTTATKVFETKNAIENGSDEIDMVINIGDLKARKFEKIEDEIKQIKDACGNKVLKVIIETCLLTDQEKKKMCEIVKTANADFIKTSTGFSTAGAKIEDIKLFKECLKNSNVKIKAAGGIRSFEDAADFINVGADRLGTSRLITE